MPMLSKKRVEELRGQRLFRMINTQDGHHGYMYKVGLNEDSEEFSVRGQCVSGGLYFAKAQSILSFWHWGDRVAEVEIPKNEPVFYVTKGAEKYRAKRIIISALYKKTDIIDTLFSLGARDFSNNLEDDIINGVVDAKYANARKLSMAKVLNAKISHEKMVELLSIFKENNINTGYFLQNYLQSSNAKAVIDAGFLIPDSYAVKALRDYFYTAPKECCYLLDHASVFERHYVEDLIRHGHVAIIRELAKRKLMPDGLKLEFEPFVSKDRKSEIKKLCAK